MVENSDFSLLLRSLIPDSTLDQVLYLDPGDAAFELRLGKNNFLFLAAEITAEEQKMLLIFSTHTKKDARDFLENRFGVLYDRVKNYLGLRPDMQIGDLMEKAAVASSTGKAYIVQYAEKSKLAAYTNGKRSLHMTKNPYYTVDKKLTAVVRDSCKGTGGRKKTILLVTAVCAVLAVTAAAFLLPRLLPGAETVEEPQEVILANLVGEGKDVAAAYLNEVGIGYTYEEEYTEKAEKGIVMAQSVKPYSTVQAGTSIVLTVSGGPDYIVAMTIDQFPEKMNYFVKDDFDLTGLTMEATYMSGEKKTISQGFSYKPQSASRVGEQDVVVSYGEINCILKMNVRAVEMVSISIYKMPDTVNYKVGEKLNTDGLIITQNMNNGESQKIERGFSCEPTVLTQAGSQKILVIYEGKTTEFTVEVSE